MLIGNKSLKNMTQEHQNLLKEDINMLIATDCLSEGQNFQDADFYDKL